MTEPAPGTRTIETTITIDAPVEEVWKALTDAEELKRWFPIDARVTPGHGGTIWLSWGKGLEGSSRIRIWEPNRRLQTVQPYTMPVWGEDRPDLTDMLYEKPAEAVKHGAVMVSVDYHLESSRGRTTLRLVHSGFGAGAEWDDEYHGVRRGWQFELRGLRHYLERHRGEPRLIAWSRAPIRMPKPEAWGRIMSPEGLLREGRLEGLRESDAYGVRAATGDLLKGEVAVLDPPHAFAGTVEGMNGAFFRVEIENCGGSPEVFVWLSAYGLPPDDVRGFQARWDGCLESLFPSPS